MKIKRILSKSGIITFVALFSLSVLPGQVGASNFTDLCSGTNILGRARCDGYFTGTSWYRALPYGLQGQNILTVPAGFLWSIPSNINTYQEFENFIGGYLGCDEVTLVCNGNYNYTYNKAGAAFIVDAMLGLKGSQLAGQGYSQSSFGGTHYAQDNWAEWVKDVTYYGQGNGGTGIRWSVSQTLNGGDINTMHVCNKTYPSTGCPQNANGSVPATYDSKDFVFYNLAPLDSEPSNEIVFDNADGTHFRIRRECANIVGSVNPLQVPAATVHPSCAGFDLNPGRPDPKQAFSISAHIDYKNASEASTVTGTPDAVMKLSVSGPSLSYTNNNIAMSQDANEISANSPSLGPTNNSGTYTVTWSITSVSLPTATKSCSGTFKIANEPYFSVDGGDVSAGASMGVAGTDCATTADQNAGIVSWNSENGSTYLGAGTTQAAFALNYLQDFATAQGTPAEVPNGLSFSNTDNLDMSGGGQDTYGGAYGSLNCVPDYFATHPGSVTPAYASGGSFSAADLGKTIYSGGDLTIGTLNVANGFHTTIYVKGNVLINGDILYSDSYPGGVRDIPSFTIVATGNIFVNPAVSELNGWYIAEPTSATSTDGIFYSCAIGFNATPLDKNLYDNCNNQLNIFGAITARQVWFGRTNGTLYSFTRSERVYFTPETWLSSPFGNSSSVNDSYDSITSLPPAL